MKDSLWYIKHKIKQEKKSISFKRIFILFSFIFIVIAVVAISIFLSAKESTALSSLKEEKLQNLLKEKGQNLNELFKDTYVDVCKRDKELAYIYLQKKLKAKDINIVLHKIKMGENFWTVAKKYGVNIDTVIGSNPELDDLKARLNQELILPNKNGVFHQVLEKEETLDLLAELYKVDKEKIKNANNLKREKLNLLDILFIPGAKPVYMSDNLRQLYAKRSMFRSPLCGTYTSLFGTRTHPVTGEKHGHQAVDIRAKIGTWVGAAADGVVVFAGWDDNLGYYIKLQHKAGYCTLYGHVSKIYVRPYQKVFAGKLIAKTGNSG
ncbi:MAG: M23 family metallopeptidase, partial [Candidatus Goldbacteria bacterium]|nr:M23 family metallopeptidase [Candidatus Goldiibacteriota bacterium]